MAHLRAVILDVDGTLVDSNDAHTHAWVEALAEAGHSIPFEKIRPLIGMGGDKLLPRVLDVAEDTPLGRQVSKRRGEIFKTRYLPGLKPTPGAHELLRRLAERGLRLVVASSAKADELDALLKVCAAQGLIEQKTSADDAEHSKPDPDIVAAALAQLGLPASQALMLGDTPYDIAAARQLGVATIAVRCGGWSNAELAGARAIYEDPAELLAHYGASPLGQP